MKGLLLRCMTGVLLAGGLLALAGCQAAGAAAYVLSGPPAVSAQFVPAKEPTLVLIEDYSNPSLHQTEAEQMTRCVWQDLKAHEAAPLVEMEKFQELNDKSGAKVRKMTIPQIGQAVGARQVIYVNIRRSSVQGNTGGTIAGTMDLRVRVVDVRTGETRWPGDAEEGYPVVVETPVVLQGDENTECSMRDQMVRSAGIQVAHLFYEWKPAE